MTISWATSQVVITIMVLIFAVVAVLVVVVVIIGTMAITTAPVAVGLGYFTWHAFHTRRALHLLGDVAMSISGLTTTMVTNIAHTTRVIPIENHHGFGR